ncbi:MAG: hypothetical protein LBI04_02115 [Treponema sp.]|nr:hypothetical protein [Treponema sp.]
MHELGIISDAEMRKFDEECLVQEPEPIYKPANPARTVRRGIGMKKSITPRRKGVKKGV